MTGIVQQSETTSAQAGEVYEPVGRVGRALETSIEAMDWLTDADDAAVETARYFARVVDAAAGTGDPQMMIKAVNFGPHLMNVLRDLGATPAARGELGKSAAEEVDPAEKLLSDLINSVPKRAA